MAEEAEKIFVTLAEAYVFVEKIIDMKYKNAVTVSISFVPTDAAQHVPCLNQSSDLDVWNIFCVPHGHKMNSNTCPCQLPHVM